MRRFWRFIPVLLLSLVTVLVINSCLPSGKPEFALRLLHTNDHHAHLEAVAVDESELGGILQRKTLIDQLRATQAKTEPLLLLDAGDIFQGTLYFNKYLGKADLDFYNALNYDASGVGNHEFDRGSSVLAEFLQNSNFPFLSANIEVAENSPLAGLIEPWKIFDLNGEKLGIFGLTTQETSVLSNPGDDVTFTDPIVAAKTAVSELKSQGVNKIIALTHIGFHVDKELARQVDDIDVIIGGHSHTPLGDMPNATEPYPVVEQAPNGQTVLLVSDWEWGKYLGDIRVSFNGTGEVVSWEGTPHPVNVSLNPDPTFATKLEKYAAPVKQLEQQVIGETEVMLDAERIAIRTGETNLGNLIADALLAKTRRDGSQVAIVNSGGIRASIPEGEITVASVLEVLPFGNTVARADLTGAQLKEALEHGVSEVEQGSGRFPQVAGLRFVWNLSAQTGSRIVEVQVADGSDRFEPLDPDATYRVVTNSFLLNGGDDYSIFQEGKNRLDTGYLMADVVMDYLKASSPINRRVEERIEQVTL